MTRRSHSAFLGLALLAVACGDAQPADDTLSPDEEVAMRAAITALDSQRESLPVDDAELESMARTDIIEARYDAGCEVMGVVSGVWYDEDLRPVFEGSWFELGTGELGGTIEGSYADGLFEGQAHSGEVEATVTGSYDGGVFLGDWETTGAQGEMIGRFEQRNAYGGYFFGIWGECR